MNRVTVAVLGLFIAILLGSGILAYVLREEPKPVGRPAAVPVASPKLERMSLRTIPLSVSTFGPFVPSPG